jgi:hypothetical protein
MGTKGEASKKRSTRSAGGAAPPPAVADNAKEEQEDKKPSIVVAASAKATKSLAPTATSDEKKIYDDYQALCRELNMDSTTSESAWAAYVAIKQNYTLEVRTDIYIRCV